MGIKGAVATIRSDDSVPQDKKTDDMIKNAKSHAVAQLFTWGMMVGMDPFNGKVLKLFAVQQSNDLEWRRPRGITESLTHNVIPNF